LTKKGEKVLSKKPERRPVVHGRGTGGMSKKNRKWRTDHTCWEARAMGSVSKIF